MSMVPPKEAIKDICDFITMELRKYEYQVDEKLDLEDGYCTITYHDPKITEKVKKILKEHGEEDTEYKAKWSTGGTISLVYNRNLDLLMLMGEIPIPLIPDEFKRCEIYVKEPTYRFIKITEVHPHVYRGHGAVHTHIEAQIKRRDTSIGQLISELRRLISDAVDCEYLLGLTE